MDIVANPQSAVIVEGQRQPWEPPAIVFERSLEAAAQGGPPEPGFAPQGFLGPLGTSGGKGTCK